MTARVPDVARKRQYPDRRANAQMTRLERVLLHVTEDDAGCWVWGAYTENGYGRLSIGGQPGLYAHRVTYEELVGEIPKGLHIDHLCRNRACCNPAHLEAVTPLENTRRGVGHGSETRCPQDHPYDEANTIRYAGRRYCRACRDFRSRNRKKAA